MTQHGNEVVHRHRNVENEQTNHPNNRNNYKSPFPKRFDNDLVGNLVFEQQVTDEVHLVKGP